MKTSDYWKDWFNERAKHASSDYVLNRGTTVRLDELERQAHIQFLAAVNPGPSDVVLDAGCGSGRNISILSPLVKEIVAVDFSEQMLQRAGERVASEKLGNVSLELGSVTELRFPDNTFDKVICASVLQYLDDPQCAAAIRCMVRVCKPGGTLVLHVKNGTSLYATSLRLVRIVQRLLGRKTMPEYYRSRAWHWRTIASCGAAVADFDSFGILTFVPSSKWIVQRLLKLEMRLFHGKGFKKFGVNLKLTVHVSK